MPLSFYVLQGSIYFNSSNDEGLPHPDLWKKVVMKAFQGLAYDNKVDLFNHCYGIERGRIVYKSETDTWVLYGTPGCESHQEMLKEVFALTGVRLETDFRTDRHYKTVKADVCAVEHSIRLAKLTSSQKQLIELNL